jgi:hypothetical protein
VRKKNRGIEHISNAELAAATRQLDDLHRGEALPAMERAVEEWVDAFRESAVGMPLRTSSRRTFLMGAAGVAGGGLVLAACSSSSSPASSTTTSTTGSTSSTVSGNKGLTGDLAVAAMAASLENLGVFAYGAALKAAVAGKLGKVPPAAATFAETAMAQHKDHAGAWNSILTSAGKSAVTVTDPALTPTVERMFGQVHDITGVAELALLIENIAAQTYQEAVGLLSSARAVGIAATIQPVEMQHAAILYYVLGRYPGIQGTAANGFATGSPLAFNPNSLARPASDYTAA